MNLSQLARAQRRVFISTQHLTAAEERALKHDRRCKDRYAAEFLSQREREHLTFLKWCIKRGLNRG
jgi:hypothetical protein